jgi:hypothetical protein
LSGTPPARESDEATVGLLKPVRLSVWLADVPDTLGFHLEQNGRSRFSHCDVDRAEPGAVHPGKGLEMPREIEDDDGRRDADLTLP